MGGRAQLEDLSRHLRRLTRLSGALCAHQGELWIIDLPDAPDDPQALAAALLQDEPDPQALRAACGAQAAHQVHAASLAAWSHALRRVERAPHLDAHIRSGHKALRAWRGQPLEQQLELWRARFALVQRVYHVLRGDEPWDPALTTRCVGPGAWGAPSPKALRDLLELPEDHTRLDLDDLHAQHARTWARVLALYGPQASRQAALLMLATQRDVARRRRVQRRRQEVFAQVCERADTDALPAQAAFPALRELLSLPPDPSERAWRLARAFVAFARAEPEEPGRNSVRALARVARATSSRAEAAKALIAQTRRAPLDQAQLLPSLHLALLAPGQLQAPTRHALRLTPEAIALIATAARHGQRRGWQTLTHEHALAHDGALLIHLAHGLDLDVLARLCQPRFDPWRGRLLHELIDATDRLPWAMALLERLDPQTPEPMIWQLVELLKTSSSAASLAAVALMARRLSADGEARWRAMLLALQLLPAYGSLLQRWSDWTKTRPSPALLARLVERSRHPASTWRLYLHHRALCGHGPTPSKAILERLEADERLTHELRWLEDTLLAHERALAPLAPERAAALARRRDAALARLAATDSPRPTDRRMDNLLERALPALRHQSLEQLLLQALLDKLAARGVGAQVIDALRARPLETLSLVSAPLPQPLLHSFLRVGAGVQTRRQLPVNQAWMASAGARGLDVVAWLAGFDLTLEIAGQRWRIHTEHDPWESVLMGHYFQTCLSLDARPIHALLHTLELDKHVIYVRDASGAPRARKLVGLTSTQALIGYRLYHTLGSEACAIHDQVKQVTLTWAARCGASPADQGQLRPLHGGELYDDGAVPWTQPTPQDDQDEPLHDLHELTLWEALLGARQAPDPRAYPATPEAWVARYGAQPWTWAQHGALLLREQAAPTLHLALERWMRRAGATASGVGVEDVPFHWRSAEQALDALERLWRGWPHAPETRQMIEAQGEDGAMAMAMARRALPAFLWACGAPQQGSAQTRAPRALRRALRRGPAPLRRLAWLTLTALPLSGALPALHPEDADCATLRQLALARQRPDPRRDATLAALDDALDDQDHDRACHAEALRPLRCAVSQGEPLTPALYAALARVAQQSPCARARAQARAIMIVGRLEGGGVEASGADAAASALTSLDGSALCDEALLQVIEALLGRRDDALTHPLLWVSRLLVDLPAPRLRQLAQPVSALWLARIELWAGHSAQGRASAQALALMERHGHSELAQAMTPWAWISCAWTLHRADAAWRLDPTRVGQDRERWTALAIEQLLEHEPRALAALLSQRHLHSLSPALLDALALERERWLEPEARPILARRLQELGQEHPLASWMARLLAT